MSAAKTLTAAEVRKRAHCSARTLRRWHDEGLRPIKPGVYSRPAVEKFLAAKRTKDAEHREAQTELARSLAEEMEARLVKLDAAHVPLTLARQCWAVVRAEMLRSLDRLPRELLAAVMRHAAESPGAVEQAITAHIRDVLTKLAGADPEPPRTESRRPRPAAPRGHTLEDERARLASVKARLARVRTAIATGALLPRVDVDAKLAAPLLNCRSRLLALARTWAPRLSAAAASPDGDTAVLALLETAVAEAAAQLNEEPFS